jgi:hypothetical protein
MSDRIAFNFYVSYWTTGKELDDDDRLAFYDALLKKQFTGQDTDLTGMARFAYLSQKYSIDRQVKGWEDKTQKSLTPTQHPTEPPIEDPSIPPIEDPTYLDNRSVITTEPPTELPYQQEQEKGQEKEKGQVELEEELDMFSPVAQKLVERYLK